MNKKKRVLIIVGILVVFFIVLIIINVSKKLYTTYTFDDSKISVTVFNKFRKIDDDRKNTDLALYNSELETYVIGRTLPEEFWASGDIMAMCDEYLRFISSMYYEREIKDVSMNEVEINGVKVGRVGLTASQKNSSNKAVTLLFPKEYNNYILEIYGSEDILKEKNNEVENIINSIKINK